MLAASLNAFFCASPIYGSAEDFTFLLNFTPCEGLTPAAKQQIGETRKKCNSDDRRQWRKQGGVVGAAASRMRAAAKQTLGAATRLSAATSFFPFRQPLRDYQGRAALDSCLPRLESSGCFSGSLLARKRELSPNATALRPRATGAQACLTARHTLHTPPSSQSPAGYRNAPARGCTGRQASSLRRRGHSPSRR